MGELAVAMQRKGIVTLWVAVEYYVLRISSSPPKKICTPYPASPGRRCIGLVQMVCGYLFHEAEFMGGKA